MKLRAWSGMISAFVGLFWLVLTVVGAQQAPPASGQARAEKTPPTPAGPLAPAKYKDVQAMKDVPVEQFDRAD